MTTMPPSLTAQISVVRDEGELRILIGNQVVATGSDISHLVGVAHRLGESDPLKFRADASLLFRDLARPEKATVLENVSEHPTLRDELMERFEELVEDFGGNDWDVPALEMEISVDGHPWGWFPEDGDRVRWPESFQLIPTGPSEELLYASTWFHGDHAASEWYTRIGIRRWSDLAAVSWSEQEVTEPLTVSVSYVIDDWSTLFLKAFDGFGGDISFPLLCPGCDESKSWSIEIVAHPMFSEELIGQVMGGIWRPCKEHEGKIEQLIVEGLAGHDWHWTGSSWTPS